MDDDDGDEEEHDDTGDILQPAILQETTRQVSRAEFRKWAHPTEKMLAEVEGIFQAAERPAMMAFRSDATRTVAQQSVQRIVSKCVQPRKRGPGGVAVLTRG